jgi:hypothetical protein
VTFPEDRAEEVDWTRVSEMEILKGRKMSVGSEIECWVRSSKDSKPVCGRVNGEEGGEEEERWKEEERRNGLMLDTGY